MPRPRKKPKLCNAYGTGRIEEKESKTKGTRYEAQAFLGLQPDGTQKRRSKTFGSKREAQIWLGDATSSASRAVKIDHRRRRVGEVAEAYIADAVVREGLNQLRPNTLTDYRRVHAKIMKLDLVTVFISDLTAHHVLNAVLAIKNGEVGKASEQDANRALKQLRRLLTFAVTEKWVAQNVALLVKPIKIDRLERSIWTSKEVRDFLKEAKRHPLHYVLFYFALSYGCRIGELMALRWRDVNLDNRTFRINHSYDSKHGEGPPKHGSRRTIHITHKAVKVLQDHQKEQEQEKEWRGDA